MSLRFALDTDVLSAAAWPDPPRGLLSKLETRGHLCALPVPVWHEFRYGVDRLPPSRRREALDRYLSDVVLTSYPLLAYDKAAADWHASERARLDRAGAPAPFVDGLIASIARVNELVLVTGNTADFRRFRGLRLQNWIG